MAGNRIYIILILLLTGLDSGLLLSQVNDFVKGEIELPNGDIQKGYLSYTKESIIRDEISFKTSISSIKIYTYRAHDLKGFKYLEENRAYSSIPYSKELLYNESNNERIFGLNLVSGYADLYKIALYPEEYENIYGASHHFYIVRKGRDWYRLQEMKTMDGNKVRTVKSYKGILKIITEDCFGNNVFSIKSRFHDNYISSVVIKYNICAAPDIETQQFRPREGKKISQVVQAVLTLPFGRKVEDQNLLEDDDPAIGFSYNFNYYEPLIDKNLFYTLGVTYYTGNISNRGNENLELSFLVNYFLYKGAQNVYFSMGGKVLNPRLLFGGGLEFQDFRMFLNYEPNVFGINRSAHFIETGIGFKF